VAIILQGLPLGVFPVCLSICLIACCMCRGVHISDGRRWDASYQFLNAAFSLRDIGSGLWTFVCLQSWFSLYVVVITFCR
jgi:hypothetical protein